ncbi:MAG TPA: type VI secretion system protein TssA [Phycisphaerae bacterium]|jgi:type VI secretion system protein ImpA
MSAIEVDALLTEISAETPGGADVEFDPAYFELEKLAQGTPESVMGDEVKPGEEADFKEVKKAAVALFEKTRDLRVAMILATSLLKEDGLVGFRDGVAIVKGFIDKLWEQFFPKLDPEDNNDPTIRVNILKGFDGDGSAADLYKFKLRLREATLTNSKQRIGRFGFRDIQVARGELPPPPPVDGKEVKPPDMPLINAAFEDTETEDLQATQNTLQELQTLLEGLDASLAEKIGAGVGPDLSGVKEVVQLLKGVIDEQLAKRGIGDAPAAEGEAGGSEGEAGSAPVRGGSLSGDISSRADVVRALDKICEYYERYEPTSPVPMFMQRAKRLVTMNFVDLIKDLAPEAMTKIEVFTGTSEAPPPA